MAFLELSGVRKGYGTGAARTEVLGGIDLAVEEGEFLAIVGFSGSGKTTLISAIAGLIDLDDGSIRLRGKDISGPSPERGIVFQSYSLMPWLTVGGNIANGSPIGDGPPAFIALGAELTLRSRDGRRTMALEDYFLDYGKQDRKPGEFVLSLTVPKPATDSHFAVYKVAKRREEVSGLRKALHREAGYTFRFISFIVIDDNKIMTTTPTLALTLFHLVLLL